MSNKLRFHCYFFRILFTFILTSSIVSYIYMQNFGSSGHELNTARCLHLYKLEYAHNSDSSCNVDLYFHTWSSFINFIIVVYLKLWTPKALDLIYLRSLTDTIFHFHFIKNAVRVKSKTMTLVCVASPLSTHTSIRVRANTRNRVNVSELSDISNHWIRLMCQSWVTFLTTESG